MKNTQETSESHDSAWRNEIKNLLIQNGARIRPLIGRGRRFLVASPEVKRALKEIQSEVRTEQKEIDHAVVVALMPVTQIDANTWKAGFPAHEHIVKHYPEKDLKWWCFGCKGFESYRHCKHVDAVKLQSKNDGKQLTLEATLNGR